MDNIESLPQDAGIAMILQKLKDTSSLEVADEVESVDNTADLLDEIVDDVSNSTDTTEEQPSEDNDSVTTQLEPADEESIQSLDQNIIDESPNESLPWFLNSDKDQKMLHYVTFDDFGNLVYNSVDVNCSPNELAAIKLKHNYACDIDYYKSRHFVLCVNQFDSDYSYSRSFTELDEDKHDASESHDSEMDLVKTPTEDVSLLVGNSDKYLHYVIFTDLGVADFVVRQNDIAYPFGESNLSKWFEEISNHIALKNAKYTPNERNLSNEANSIRDFKYDIITMHTPGVITLDSVDNDDQNYKIHIKLKDKYNFIPLNRILKCLRYYATHKEKSLDDFKLFINQYFDFNV